MKIVNLPAGDDPDSIVRKKGKEGLLKLLEGKEDFFDYKMRILKNSYDLESIQGKTKQYQICRCSRLKMVEQQRACLYKVPQDTRHKHAAAKQVHHEIAHRGTARLRRPPCPDKTDR